MRGYLVIGTLTFIAIISGGLLAWANVVSLPLIQENRRVATAEAVLSVLPGTKEVSEVKRAGVTLFEGKDSDGRAIGLAIPVDTSGFQGNIKMMVGVDSEFKKILGLKIIENIETPGLGNLITEADWLKQFAGLSAEDKIIVIKNQTPEEENNEIEAITGATISSQAVADGLNRELARESKKMNKVESR